MASQDRQTWQRDIDTTLKYGAVRGVRHQRQIGQQRPYFVAGVLWYPELVQIIYLKVE